MYGGRSSTVRPSTEPWMAPYQQNDVDDDLSPTVRQPASPKLESINLVRQSLLRMFQRNLTPKRVGAVLQIIHSPKCRFLVRGTEQGDSS